ncbi:MAG: hypothetical protein OXU63_09805 [Acidobacteriota bacterium]|nr:hypothetical protein [Acidobacteriota bacterium]
MSAATDTLQTAQTLTEAGVPERQAAAHARAIDDAVGELVTRDHLHAEMAALRADVYRALWIQGGVIVGVVVALVRLIP